MYQALYSIFRILISKQYYFSSAEILNVFVFESILVFLYPNNVQYKSYKTGNNRCSCFSLMFWIIYITIHVPGIQSLTQLYCVTWPLFTDESKLSEPV